MKIPIAAAILALAATQAEAQTQKLCGNLELTFENLERELGVVPAFSAVTFVGRGVVVLVNPDTGQWVISSVEPGGGTCWISEGQHWHEIDPEPVPEGTAL